MMLRTGKGGRCRYLVCANRAIKATFFCDAPQIRMEAIDDLVLREVEAKVLAPERVKSLISAMVEARDASRASLEQELARQKEALRKAESGLRNLYGVLATAPDLYSLDDPQFREQVAMLKRQRSELEATVPALQQRLSGGMPRISDETIATFSNAVRRRLRDADPAFRRQWLRLFVDQSWLAGARS